VSPATLRFASDVAMAAVILGLYVWIRDIGRRESAAGRPRLEEIQSPHLMRFYRRLLDEGKDQGEVAKRVLGELISRRDREEAVHMFLREMGL
jgi:hypothetical protein